jgi:hypothetical protein
MERVVGHPPRPCRKIRGGDRPVRVDRRRELDAAAQPLHAIGMELLRERCGMQDGVTWLIVCLRAGRPQEPWIVPEAVLGSWPRFSMTSISPHRASPPGRCRCPAPRMPPEPRPAGVCMRASNRPYWKACLSLVLILAEV